MQNELEKIMAMACTIIAIATESALIISGMMYDMSERIIIGVISAIVVVPMLVCLWCEIGQTSKTTKRKNH